MGERLKHKNRAITPDDYEKLIWEFEKKIINTYDNELLKNYIDNIKNISS